MAWYDNALMEVDMRLNGGTKHHAVESVMGSRRRCACVDFKTLGTVCWEKIRGGVT